MKLFSVTMTVQILVAAKDESDAWVVADSMLGDAIRDGGVSPEVESATEIKRIADIPSEWKGGLVYHNGREDITAESLCPTALDVERT